MLNANSDASSPGKILLQVSGSIAAFKAVALCSKLVQSGYNVEVILSVGAINFVGPASFEGLTGKRVHQGNFEEGQMMAHIDLERWADLILLYPASANVISHLAHGNSDSLIGALFLAHEFKKPYLIAPAMNQAMHAHPAVRKNIESLKSWGVTFAEPEIGPLACGEIGTGRLVEPEKIFEQINAHFNQHVTISSHKSVLITSGGTSEPIDPVRSLTNFSTGQTGFSLANTLQEQGYEVTLLQSKRSPFQMSLARTVLYDTTDQFASLLRQELEQSSYDVLIHAAAVSDYAVESITNDSGQKIIQTSKIQGTSGLILKLKPNPKLLKSVRGWSKNKALQVISFKLTTGDDSDLKLETYDSDAIIHNDLGEIQNGAHTGTVFTRNPSGDYQKHSHFQNKTELSKEIISLIEAQSKSKERQQS